MITEPSPDQLDFNSNPSAIYFTNGNVTKYVYSVTGQKLRAIYYTAMPYITRTFGKKPVELTQSQILYKDSTDYLLGGCLVMKNGKIDKCYFEGGFVRAFETSETTDRFVFYYYNKDHLGNNREVVDIKGRVMQVTNYYPFGAPYADDTAMKGENLQPYKYNCKELDKMHGLNTYDYGARQYDPILCRWDRMDPLCEKYYSISPYAYCGNDPINCIDKEGKEKQQYLNREELKKSDYYQYPYNTPGTLNIWAHGVYDAHYDEFASGIEVGKVGKIDDAQGFHDAILKYSSEWKKNGGENMIIVLHSCGTSDFAKKLSEDDMFKGKNITFVAPNARLKVSPKGSKVNGKIFFQANTNWQKRIKTEDGRWMSYKDGELVGTESATAQPGKDNKELQKPPYNEKKEE